MLLSGWSQQRIFSSPLTQIVIYPIKILQNQTPNLSEPPVIIEGTKGAILMTVVAFSGRNTVFCIRQKSSSYQCILFEVKRSEKKKFAVETNQTKAFTLSSKEKPISLRTDLLPGIITICCEYGIYNVNVSNEKSTRKLLITIFLFFSFFFSSFLFFSFFFSSFLLSFSF